MVGKKGLGIFLMVCVSFIFLFSVADAANNLTVSSNVSNGTTWLKGGSIYAFNFTVLVSGMNASTNITRINISNVNVTLNNTAPLTNQSGWSCTAFNATSVNCSGAGGYSNNSLAINIIIYATMFSSYEMNHSWVIITTDNYSGSNTTTWNTAVDGVVPAITHNYPSNNSYYNYAPYFNGTCADTGSGLSSIYTNFTEYGTVDTTSPYNFTNSSNLTQSVYAVLVYCNDTTNNTNFSMFYFTYDATNPASTINWPVNMTNTTNNTPNFNITLSDDIGSAINYTFFINDTGNKTGVLGNSSATNITMDVLPDGLYRIKVQATDNASNRANSSEYWFVVDTVSPAYSTNSTNSTYAGQAINHSLYWQDNYSLVSYMFSFDNGDGTFVNDPWTNMTGTGNWSNFIQVVNSTVGSTIRWKVYVNDSAGNWNVSLSYTYLTTDGNPPTSSYDATDSTYAGEAVLHSLYWQDNNALFAYMFSFDNGNGTFENDSWTNMTGTGNWSNVTKTVNSTVGSTIRWKVYANDSVGNWNVSSTYDYTTIPRHTGGSGGGGSIVSKWVKEIKLNDSDLNLGQTLKGLKENYRITFNVRGMGHHMDVKNITNTTATIEIASTPQTVTLAVGGTKKFDFDEDNYYDLSVTLDSILNNMADITLKRISEPIDPSVKDVTGGVIAPSEETDQENQNPSAPEQKPIIGFNYFWIIVSAALIVVIVLIIIFSKLKKSR